MFLTNIVSCKVTVFIDYIMLSNNAVYINNILMVYNAVLSIVLMIRT